MTNVTSKSSEEVPIALKNYSMSKIKFSNSLTSRFSLNVLGYGIFSLLRST